MILTEEELFTENKRKKEFENEGKGFSKEDL